MGYLTTHTPLPERPSSLNEGFARYSFGVGCESANSWLLVTHHEHAGVSGLWPWSGYHDEEVAC